MLVDPALNNLIKRHRVEVVKLLTALPKNDNEVRSLQQAEVLGHGLSGHVEMPT